MKMGLADAWGGGKVRDLPPENWERLTASVSLANALGDEGKYARAEAMYRELLPTQCRVLGHEHPSTLRSGMNLTHNHSPMRLDVADAAASQGPLLWVA